MRMAQTEVYTFDELSDSAKQSALDRYRDWNINYEWWNFDGLLDLSSQEMKDRRIKFSKYPSYTRLFKYSKFYFSIGRDWFIEFVDLDVTDDDVFRKFLRIPKRLWENLNYDFVIRALRYDTTTISFEPDFYGDRNDGRDFTEHELDILARAKDIFDVKVQEALYMLQSNYEYLLSDEAIIESFEANECEFTENGELW